MKIHLEPVVAESPVFAVNMDETCRTVSHRIKTPQQAIILYKVIEALLDSFERENHNAKKQNP